MLKDLHSRYGTRFVLNIYFTTDDGFDLTSSPTATAASGATRRRLKLSFHAHAECPTGPTSTPRPRSSRPTWTWWPGRSGASPARRLLAAHGDPLGHGRPGLQAPDEPRRARPERLLRPADSGWDVNYLLDDERSEYLSRHDALKDFESGIVFSRIDIV